MNTKIEYQYRDAENYKKRDTVIIQGHISSEEFTPLLYDNEYFIPSEVGLKDLQELPFQHYDHIWHEILDISPTDDQPTCNIDANHLLQAFHKASDNDWNVVEVWKRKRVL